MWSPGDVCVCLHLIFPALKKAEHGPKSPGVIYSGQQAEWQTSLNQHATMRGNLKTLTRIKLCFDFLISLISSGARYCVIFLPWHDILFWAMTAVCHRFGDGGKGGSIGMCIFMHVRACVGSEGCVIPWGQPEVIWWAVPSCTLTTPHSNNT